MPKDPDSPQLPGFVSSALLWVGAIGSILGLMLQARTLLDWLPDNTHPVSCAGLGPDARAEAENAQLQNDAFVMNDHKGYSGQGFVVGFGGGHAGTSIKFTISSPYGGNYIVRTCYANAAGSVYRLDVRVNGAQVRPITLPSHDRWDQWDEVVQRYQLRKGDNSIEYFKASDAPVGVNVDFIDVLSEEAIVRQQRWNLFRVIAMAGVLVVTLLILTGRWLKKSNSGRNAILTLNP